LLLEKYWLPAKEADSIALVPAAAVVQPVT